MLEVILLICAIALLFYVVFGGADFGAGILEAFPPSGLRKPQQTLITKTMGPVWEANHIWLILVVVILFVAQPKLYSLLCVHFHIPLLVMLVGIVFRGCAFTFRHYDAIKEKDTQSAYTRLFVASSILTPLCLGLTAGGMISAKVPETSVNFQNAYITPWLNLFSFSVGFFLCVLCAFLASAFLVGETDSAPLKRALLRRAKLFNLIALPSGLAVFTLGYAETPMIQFFVQDTISLGCVLLATVLLWPLWLCLNRGFKLGIRFFSVAQVSLILVGWFKSQYPTAIFLQTTSGATKAISFFQLSAPEATLRSLLIALIVGIAVIFPSLGFLFFTFQKDKA